MLAINSKQKALTLITINFIQFAKRLTSKHVLRRGLENFLLDLPV